LLGSKIEHDPCDHVHDGPVRTSLFSFPILQCFSSASFHDETILASLSDHEFIAIGENLEPHSLEIGANLPRRVFWPNIGGWFPSVNIPQIQHIFSPLIPF
jgi:hypothetical protein